MIKVLIILLFFMLHASCTKDIEKSSKLKEKSLDLQVKEVYMEGVKSLEEGDVLFAAKKFNEVEILYPQSDLAPRLL